jgi:hypothetical protein
MKMARNTKNSKKETGTDVTVKRKNQVPAGAPVGNPFKRRAAQISKPMMPFLNFSGKNGKFTYGQDKTALKYGSHLAANMMDFKSGWICWVDDEVVEEIMVGVFDEAVSEDDLTDHEPVGGYDDGDGWREQTSVPLRDVDTGEQMLYKTSAASANRVLGGLLDEFGDAFVEHEEDVPVVEIDAEEFEVTLKDEKTGKKKKHVNYKPVFEIVEWLTPEDVAELMGADAAAEEKSDDPDDYDLEDDDDVKAEAEGEDAEGLEEEEGEVEGEEDEEPARSPRKSGSSSRISDKKPSRRRGK